jgi:mannose-6-phosphate isomerase-like protein (cupin superfamily)
MNAHQSAQPGAALVTIRAGAVTRRCVARACDLVLVVMAGRLDLSIGDDGGRAYRSGEVAMCPRGEPWRLHPPAEDVRLLAVAVPAGPEAVLRELARTPRLDDAALIALAADAGVELLLDAYPG